MAFLRLQKRMLDESEALQEDDFLWSLKILCSLKKIDPQPFPTVADLSTPYTIDLLIRTAKLFGLRILKVHKPSCRISGKTLPSLALSCINDSMSEGIEGYELRLDLIVGSSAGKITYMPALGNQLITARCDEYAKRYSENLLLIVDWDEDATTEIKK
jgi:hypothetical protein